MNERDALLTGEELFEIVWYTVQKINSYPEKHGKTVENYFDLLFPDEAKIYLMRREINRRGKINRNRREGCGHD